MVVCYSQCFNHTRTEEKKSWGKMKEVKEVHGSIMASIWPAHDWFRVCYGLKYFLFRNVLKYYFFIF
jgi:hypothetical protein